MIALLSLLRGLLTGRTSHCDISELRDRKWSINWLIEWLISLLFRSGMLADIQTSDWKGHEILRIRENADE